MSGVSRIVVKGSLSLEAIRGAAMHKHPVILSGTKDLAPKHRPSQRRGDADLAACDLRLTARSRDAGKWKEVSVVLEVGVEPTTYRL